MPEGGIGLKVEARPRAESVEKGARALFETMKAEPYTTTPLQDMPWMSAEAKGLLADIGVRVVNKTRKIAIPAIPTNVDDIPFIIRSRVPYMKSGEGEVVAQLRNEAMRDTALILDKFIRNTHAMPDKFGNDHRNARRGFGREMREQGKYQTYKEEYLEKNTMRKNVLTDVASFLEAAPHDYGVIDPSLAASMEGMAKQLMYLIRGDQANGIPQYEEMTDTEKIAIVRISTDFAGEALRKMLGEPSPNTPVVAIT